jgi:hypothetical protein
MLISYDKIYDILNKYQITVKGAFHIGAHECEELDFYKKLKLTPENIFWVEAIKSKVSQAENSGIPNVYNAVITDKDDENILFNVSNNIQSSSILELHTHRIEYPHIYYTGCFYAKSITIRSFFEKNNIDYTKLNFWNFDIQGAELLALKGAGDIVKHADVLYLEVNAKELYKGCALIDEIDNYLSSFGFSREITEMTQHGWGDAIYIKTKHI